MRRGKSQSHLLRNHGSAHQARKLLLVGVHLWLCLVSVWGCGYRLKGTGEPVGISIQSLAIPTIESTSSSLGFEGDFTRIVRQEFISHAKFPLVSREVASTVLLGKIRDIETKPLSYEVFTTDVEGEKRTYPVTKSRQLILRLEMKMIDVETGRVIWQDNSMEEKAPFAVSADPIANRFSERIALQEAAQRLAQRVYQKTMERF